MEERIQVHHNYISAISNREHKKDLINRIKRSDPHNKPAYEAEMTCHMIMHDDVLGRILTILKQDDYYRTLEELPIIDSLTAYDDIQLFPELYDTTTIIERVTGEADLIKRQLRQPGMYPLPKTPLPSTLSFVPRPTPTFQPIAPDMSPKTVNIHHTNDPQSVETLPESSLPCEQWTPMGSISTNHTLHLKEHHNHLPLHNLNSSLLLGQILIRPPSLPFQLQRHTNLCPAHHHSTSPSLQMVKEWKTVSQQLDITQQMDDSVSDASSLDTSRKTAPNSHTAPGAGQEDMCPQGVLLNRRVTGQLRKKIVRTKELTEESAKGHKTNHSFCTLITDVSTVPVITKLTIVP